MKIESLAISNWRSIKSLAIAFQDLMIFVGQALGIKHTFTRPYRPQTHGNAERFIQTCLREWAYGRIWSSSAERTAWLPAFLAYYIARRPHSALACKPPASRRGGYNLLQLDRALLISTCATALPIAKKCRSIGPRLLDRTINTQPAQRLFLRYSP